MNYFFKETYPTLHIEYKKNIKRTKNSKSKKGDKHELSSLIPPKTNVFVTVTKIIHIFSPYFFNIFYFILFFICRILKNRISGFQDSAKIRNIKKVRTHANILHVLK